PGPVPAAAAAGDWPTYLHDAQRTAANPDETVLSTANAGQLVPIWSAATGGPIASGVTVIGGTAYFGSWDGFEYAVDAATGAQRWRTNLGTTHVPGCFPPDAGVTSTAAVQGGVVYVGGGDDSWYALDAATGSVLWKVPTGDNSPTGGHYNWASPLLANGFAYIGIASFGDCPLVPGRVLKVDLSTHQVVATFEAVQSGQVGGGVWTSPSLDAASNTVFVTTGSPGADGQPFSQAIVALDGTTLAVKGSWKIPTEAQVADSDWSTSPIVFPDSSGRTLVASSNKNGLLYAFDDTNISAGPVWQQRIAIGGDCPTCGDATVASAAFANGVLYVAGGNTTIGGAGSAGFVRALNANTGAILWEHPDPAAVIAAVAYANGLVYAGAGATLEVLAASTGARLYDYATGATLYGAPTVANGRVYAGSVDGHVYAWAQPASPPPPPPADPNCPSGWTCQDVGPPQPAGSETVSGSTWTVTAGGAGVAGTADRFRLVSKPMSGNGQVTATLSAQQLPGAGAQAGLMVRQSADEGAPFYAVLRTLNGLTVLSRTTPGGSVLGAVTVAASAPPFHLEIQRAGDVFRAATSPDGVTYTLVPGSSVTLVLPTSALTGVAVASGTAGTTVSATFAGVAIAALGAAPAPPPSPSPCPSGWSCGDVGNPAVVGDQALSGGSWTVKGAGGDIWDTIDQFHFVWQSVAADATVSARLTSQTPTDQWAKAGVMLRQSAADTASIYYALFVTPGNGLTVQYRSVEGLRTQQPVLRPGTPPVFIRVARSGSTFTAYTSADGATWTPVAGSTVALGVSGAMLAGMAVSSHSAGTLGTVAMDTVSVANTSPTPPNACPNGWTCADVGGATPAGTQSLNGSTWTLQGGGGDIWGTSDQFHFVSQSLAGDGTVSARVTAQGNTDPWAKAGVMLRQTADPGSAYYAAELTPGNGVAVQYRSSFGAGAAMSANLAGTAPVLLRVARSGSSFTAYTSTDGSTWTPVAGSGVTLSVSGAMLAGLAVTSHNAAAASAVTFDSVAVAAGAPTCPVGWSCADVGGATPAGTQSLNGSTWTVQGGGGDIWGTSDQFHLVSQPLAADGTVSARVAAQGNTSPWAKAGVMVRQTADPASAFYAAEVTPGNGVTVQYRSPAGASAAIAGSLAGTVPVFLRVARSGSTFTAYTSADGTTWTAVAGSTVTLSV
ncbi:MAG TPA: PQQ-binding-like beta-propeller repeat protein, partial [Candidatus Dormibacteraeota bacterium]